MGTAALGGAALLVGVIAGVAYANGTLNHFYVYGAGTDAFWFAGLIWKMDLRMTNPPSIDHRSFFATHVSPFLYAPGLLSRLWGSGPIPYFAAFIGVLHGLTSMAFAGTIGLALLRAAAGPWLAAAACLLAGAAFIAMPIQFLFMQLPHYEIVLPGALLVFLAALADGRHRLATISFVALLAIREDAGLHAAMFLLAWSAALWLHGAPADRRLLGFAAAGIAWAAIAFPLGRLLAGGESQGVIYNLYLGRPLFVHMGIDQVMERIEYFLLHRTELWCPLAAIAVVAAIRRDMLLFAGVAAVLPWIALHVGFGAQPAPAKLAFYYAFPLVAAFAWPSLRLLMQRDDRVARRWMVALQALVILLGFMPALGGPPEFRFRRWLHASLLSTEGLAQAEHYRAFEQAIRAHRATLGSYVASNDVTGLVPLLITRQSWLEGIRPQDEARIDRIDTLMLFERPRGCDPSAIIINRLRPPHAFEFAGTRVVMLTRLPVASFDAWGPQLIERAPGTPLCDRPALR